MFSLDRVFHIASHVAHILAALAGRGVVHGQIRPEHVLYDPETGATALLDFGQARFERAIANDPEGRLKQHSDDLADLGRLTVWMLHPEVRFDTIDVETELPTMSDGAREVIRRLRHAGQPGAYCRADAARADLERLSANPDASPGTTLGAPPDLALPVAHLGREREIAALVGAYDEMLATSAMRDADTATAAGAKAVFVDGLAGIGKTAVIGDACRILARRGARVTLGKFNQFGDSRPLWALTQALDKLMADIGADTEARRTAQVARIRAALLDLAQVVVDAVPGLAALIGPQPAPPALSGWANRMRFEVLMRRFVAALTSPEEPLVLVLDDVHWADQQSLAMLRSLLRDPALAHVLILAAYRTEAVPPEHPLVATMEAIRADTGELRRVSVKPWTPEEIGRLLDHVALRDGDSLGEFAQVLFDASHGNPLGVLHALRETYDSGAVAYEEGRGGWTVDLARSRAALRDTRTLDLVRRQLDSLPPLSQHALSTGAFLGASFSLDMLATAMGLANPLALAALWPAMARGLLNVEPETGENIALPRLRLIHDVVQQAAHELVDAAAGAERHAAIARALFSAYNMGEELKEHLFDVILHFNRAGVEAIGVDERNSVISLNMAAGRTARANGAASAALQHFSHAHALLTQEDWQNNADTAFDITWQLAEAAYLATDFERLDTLTDELAARAQTPLATAHTQELRIQGMLARNQLADALTLGEQTLALLGVQLEPLAPPNLWPPVPTQEELASGAASDERVDTALRVLVWLTPCAYITSFEMYVRVILTMMALARAHPNSPLTAISFTNYGLTLCGVGRNPEGFAAGELALALSRQVPDEALRCKVWTLTYGFIWHWRRPAQDALKPMLDTLQACLLCGDQEYAGYASFLYCDKAWNQQNLAELERSHARHTVLVGQFGHEFSWRHCQVWLQFVRALRGRSDQTLTLQGDAFDEVADIARMVETKNHFSLFTAHALRAWLAWHRGDPAAALACCQDASAYAMTSGATLLSVEHLLLTSLCELRGYAQCPPQAQARVLDSADATLARLAQWADWSPTNFAHKLAWLKAEQRRAQGLTDEARALFEEASKLADASSFIHDRALIAQATGDFLAALGDDIEAEKYYRSAYEAYREWGASALAAATNRGDNSTLGPNAA
jgi:predicted ATPase